MADTLHPSSNGRQRTYDALGVQVSMGSGNRLTLGDMSASLLHVPYFIKKVVKYFYDSLLSTTGYVFLFVYLVT